MVQMQSYLKVADNTGAKETMCIRVLGGSRYTFPKFGCKSGRMPHPADCGFQQSSDWL